MGKLTLRLCEQVDSLAVLEIPCGAVLTVSTYMYLQVQNRGRGCGHRQCNTVWAGRYALSAVCVNHAALRNCLIIHC